MNIENKEILKDFEKNLSSLNVNENFSFRNKNGYRKEGEPKKIDLNFINRFLSNCKKISGNFVIANRGEWEK